ncbi:MAG TPA: methyltransferase [Casimicrobiaceae bacterium]|jgi:ubiquinone/menaquinone biosynthesis C-methylase UbiE|nr:methyltransferase [Casimicrobiaceae bacterium]
MSDEGGSCAEYTPGAAAARASARATMLQLIAGLRVSRVLYAAARLGLADLLRDGPSDSASLASVTGTHAPSLHRLMRALASIDVLAEDEQHRFSLTALGNSLRSDVPDSLREWALLALGDEHFQAWGQLLYSVRTGGIAFDHVFGTDVWTYRAAHAEHAAIFDQAMAQLVTGYDAKLVAAFPFATIARLVDVGGGDGTLLIAILQAHPAMHGVLFDLPHVAERARDRIGRAGLSHRCEIIAGDAFAAVPPGGDAYLLSRVIHDWDDRRAITILDACRRAMGSEGRVLIAERVMPARTVVSPAAQSASLSDLTMLVMNGGRERTEGEYRELLAGAGLALAGIVPIDGGNSVLEARLAP